MPYPERYVRQLAEGRPDAVSNGLIVIVKYTVELVPRRCGMVENDNALSMGIDIWRNALAY